MHYTGMTFRPPFEAMSVILQVTAGCSHNACAFCSMYRDVPFAVSPLEEVEADLAEAAQFAPYANRVFLANGDALCLSADQLLEIARLIRAYLPRVRTIGGYASVRNVWGKTDAELAALAKAGFANFNFGLESALDDVLAHMNKGFTVAAAREQFGRLNAAGMPFNVNIVNAAAGPARIVEHAQANAAFLNEVQPTLVFVSPLHVDPGTPLYEEVAAGEFEECTLGQYLQEELELLRGLELADAVFYGLHMSNPVQVAGRLPRDKQEMIESLEQGLADMPQHLRDSHPLKGREGRIIG